MIKETLWIGIRWYRWSIGVLFWAKFCVIVWHEAILIHCNCDICKHYLGIGLALEHTLFLLIIRILLVGDETGKAFSHHVRHEIYSKAINWHGIAGIWAASLLVHNSLPWFWHLRTCRVVNWAFGATVFTWMVPLLSLICFTKLLRHPGFPFWPWLIFSGNGKPIQKRILEVGNRSCKSLWGQVASGASVSCLFYQGLLISSKAVV